MVLQRSTPSRHACGTGCRQKPWQKMAFPHIKKSHFRATPFDMIPGRKAATIASRHAVSNDYRRSRAIQWPFHMRGGTGFLCPSWLVLRQETAQPTLRNATKLILSVPWRPALSQGPDP